jgi:hypothetical protein
VHIPKWSEIITPAAVKGKTEHRDVIFEPKDTFMSKYQIFCPETICRIKDNEIPVRLLNLSPKPKMLRAGTMVGTIIVANIIDPNSLPNPPRLNPDLYTMVQLGKRITKENPSISSPQAAMLNSLLHRYRHIFAKDDYDLGRTSVVQHTIPVPQNNPIKQRPYRIPQTLQEEAKKQIDEMLSHDIIRPSCSPWTSPALLVKKKDGTLRFCVDYRKLNSVTHKDTYPLPRVDDMLDKLNNSCIFTTLDLASGYWQIEVHEKDKEKTAFSMGSGLYEFNVMPFGLSNAPSCFQRMVDFLLLDVTHALVYLDDVLVFSRDFTEHLTELETVFRRK